MKEKSKRIKGLYNVFPLFFLSLFRTYRTLTLTQRERTRGRDTRREREKDREEIVRIFLIPSATSIFEKGHLSPLQDPHLGTNHEN